MARDDALRGSVKGKKCPGGIVWSRKKQNLVLVLSFSVDHWCRSGRRYLASIPFATMSRRYCLLARRRIANSIKELLVIYSRGFFVDLELLHGKSQSIRPIHCQAFFLWPLYLTILWGLLTGHAPYIGAIRLVVAGSCSADTCTLANPKRVFALSSRVYDTDVFVASALYRLSSKRID